MNYINRFKYLKEFLKTRKNINVALIEKAFKFAEDLHQKQFRKSGEPYISHPVEVAIIVARLGFDENMIAAALLHDVVEDCDCTIEELKKIFNAKIGNLVDAVTAIKEYEGNAEFKKFLMKEQTYNKLYSFAMNEKLAFYIKFADRLHNLSTISIFPRYKQIEKIKETQKWLTPILRSIKAVGIYYKLENYCHAILEKNEYSLYNKYYKQYLKNSEMYTNNIKTEFAKNLSKYSRQVGNFLEIIFEEISLFEIKTNQPEYFEVRKEKVDQFIFGQMITHKIFIIVKNLKKKDESLQKLVRIFSQFHWFKPFKVIGFYQDKKFDKSEALIIQDERENQYLVYLMDPKERFQYMNGEVAGIDVPYDTDLDQFEISENYIKVFTNKNEVILMPERSTVLDFAFKIHNDFGFSCMGAYINDSPVKVPVYTVLNNGDKVNLVIERDPQNQKCVDMSQLKWLSYVNTDAAKRKLIKNFENKYEKYHK